MSAVKGSGFLQLKYLSTSFCVPFFPLHHSFSVRAEYNQLHNTLMAIDEHEDLRWWKNTNGPGMPTDWPHFQVFQFFTSPFNSITKMVHPMWRSLGNIQFFALKLNFKWLFFSECFLGMDAWKEKQKREERGGKERSRKESNNREEVSIYDAFKEFVL